jgi:hypothetical protein
VLYLYTGTAFSLVRDCTWPGILNRNTVLCAAVAQHAQGLNVNTKEKSKKRLAWKCVPVALLVLFELFLFTWILNDDSFDGS